MTESIKLGPPSVKIHGPIDGKIGEHSVRVCLNVPTNIEVEFVHAGRRSILLTPGDWDFSERIPPGGSEFVQQVMRVG